MFLNVVRRLLFIYFVCLHLHCCLTGTGRFVNTPLTCDDRIVGIALSILQAQWPAVFVLHVCEIMNANCVSLPVEILLLYNVGGKKER